MAKKISAHYISGTHWDREWYRPFEEYRFLLVDLMDSLLDLMETNQAFRYFQLDGQTCMLEDYLDMRPENRDRLASLIRNGRILIGPWFTMPDLFCPDGESLIRNLLLGNRIAREWGVDPMSVGFTCDMFGHPSQMPQIFAGFGIRDVVLGRGTNESTTDMFFHWTAPDGTDVLVFKLEDKVGYGAFAVPRSILEADGKNLHAASRDKAKAEMEEDEAETEENEQKFREKLADYIDHEGERANLPVVPIMDNMDHMPPAENVELYLRLIAEACPQVDVKHSTLPELFAEARKLAETAAQIQKRTGELREPAKERCGFLYLIPNCVSSRVRMKQAGDAAASLLQHWADPMFALGTVESPETAEMRPFLDQAWKNVLLNHAHDSVCGCSIDQVHRDMMYRFDQSRILSEQLRNRVFAALTRNSANIANSEDEFTLTLFNPMPVDRNESVEFDVDLPLDYPASFHEGFRTQEIKAFILETGDGEDVPYQRLRFKPVTSERSKVAKYCFDGDGPMTRYTVAATLNLPAFGFISLRVKPVNHAVRTVGTLRTAPTAAENEFLAVKVNPNGTIDLTDKKSGEVYRDLLTFEDRSEIGDGWFHGESVNDEAVVSTCSTSRVSVVHDGPEQVTFRIQTTLELAKQYDLNREAPSTQTVLVRLSSDVTLRRGADALDVVTTLQNNAEDHRLQLLLPTDAINAKTYVAHIAFDMIERSIQLAPETRTWSEMEITEKPFESLQAVGDKRRGLAFISGGGLHEGGVRDDQRRTMQVTLLRSFRKTVATQGEQDGLEQGEIVYRYALMPYGNQLPAAKALRYAMKLQSGLIKRQTGRISSGYPEMSGEQPATRSFMRQSGSGEVVLSAAKPAESGDGRMVLRLWNPTEKREKTKIEFWRSVKKAELLRLDETPETGGDLKLDVGENSVAITLPGKKIATVAVTV